ncbi:MAG: HEAT repeat domain-containing protein [Treponema sp.]|nr:HEAT repeat domain-containing protein [Treponema sp.]
MSLLNRFSILIALAVFSVSIAAAQSSGRDRETTVEESYLQQSIENMIIRETARASNRDQKLIALAYIGEAIDRGNTSDDVRNTLEFLCLEGTKSVARENGRVMNNFPDIRWQAVKYLGAIGTEEAKYILLEICQYESEPMVLQEAIKVLGDIGLNENNETVTIIARVVSRMDSLNPDNLVALATVDTFEKIAKKNNGINSSEAIRLLMRISEGSYIRPVQDRARQLLADLRRYN